MNVMATIRDGASSGVHPALDAFLAAEDLSPEAVAHFTASHGAPLVEPGALTFLWRGEARGVNLLLWINAGVDRRAFTRVEGTDLWTLRIGAMDGGRFEYKLEVAHHHGEAWITDPLNPHKARDPYGENSVAMSHGYARPDWTLDRGAPRGRIEELAVESPTFGAVRREKLYLPAGYDARRRYPLIVVHDGGDYDDYADLTTSLDNLIDAGEVRPLVAVMIQTGDRMGEYPRGRRHARYVAQEMLPAVQAAVSISAEPAERVLLGASLGAVASISTAFRFPGLFGGLILKSGSFVLDRAKLRHRAHPVFHRVARLVEALRRAPTPEGLRAFVSTGELEGLADENRALADLLSARGVEVMFKSAWDGHHWQNWRDQLRDALIWTLGEDRRE